MHEFVDVPSDLRKTIKKNKQMKKQVNDCN
jgi:hypothetical protein